MVQNAKQVALNIHDPKAASRWRDSNNALINAVVNVRNAVSPDVLPDLSNLRMGTSCPTVRLTLMWELIAGIMAVKCVKLTEVMCV